MLKQLVRAVLPQFVLNAREASYYAKYGEVEMLMLPFLCRRYQAAVDVGANCGSYIHDLRRYAVRVHAFEPLPSFVADLRKKFGNDPTVIIHPIALSNQKGMVELHTPMLDGKRVEGCATVSDVCAATFEATEAISVPTDRLDSVCADDAVGFIKIDVEGYEMAVLEGAVNTIMRCRPRVIIEIDEQMAPGGLARATTFFDRMRYNGYYIYGRELYSLMRFSIERLQNPANGFDLNAGLPDRLHRTVPYINNFIFVPAEDSDEVAGSMRDAVHRVGRELARA